MGERIRYVLTRKWFPGGWAARTRAFWHYVVRRYGYEICGECGRPVGVVWHAPDDLWLAVAGDENGVLCPQCFDTKAWHIGQLINWQPERFPLSKSLPNPSKDRE